MQATDGDGELAYCYYDDDDDGDGEALHETHSRDASVANAMTGMTQAATATTHAPPAVGGAGVYTVGGYKDSGSTAPAHMAASTINLRQVLAIMQHSAADLAERAGITATASVLVLQQHRWSVEQALAAFAEDPERVLAHLHLDGGVAEHASQLQRSTRAMKCAVCTERVAAGQASGLVACGHYFCNSCWCDVLGGWLTSGGNIDMLRCPQHGCGELLDLQMACDVLLTNGDAAKAQRLKLLHAYASMYVDASPRLRWCANPRSCEAVVCIGSDGVLGQTVTCQECGYAFCFKCAREPHEPATCDNVTHWQKVLNSGCANLITILKITKPCPSCKMPIEKNHGCNHMTCWHGCRYEFCWICLGSWRGHVDAYNCRAAPPKPSAPTVAAGAGTTTTGGTSRVRMSNATEVDFAVDGVIQRRFVSAHETFCEHKRSNELEQRDVQHCLAKASVLTRLVTGVPPHQSAELVLRAWLDATGQVLATARNMLAYACVCGCFMDDDDTEARLLGQTRWKLQRETERLSGLLRQLKEDESVQLSEMNEALHLVQSWAAKRLFD